MRDSLRIRLADEADAAVVDELLTQFSNSLGDADLYQGSAEKLLTGGLGDDRYFSVLLAEIDDRSVGLVIFFPEFSTWRCARGVYVQDLFVDPQWQGYGVGKELIRASVARASEQWAANYLKLSVGLANESARNFYCHLGMTTDVDNDVMVLEDDYFEKLAR
ncbi:MAG: GNAT superfamily N-acetyltransferase [Parasphingorhabdus sp.]|jgi:GNAT superfamily N-acetyltransferase